MSARRIMQGAEIIGQYGNIKLAEETARASTPPDYHIPLR